MHIRESLNPNTSYTIDSFEHFSEGISNLIELISELAQQFPTFTPEQQTRAGLATYDAGSGMIGAKSKWILKKFF